MNLKLNMGAHEDVYSSGSNLYSEILFSQTNRKGQPVAGISILVREIGNPDNIIIVDIHNPHPKVKFECIKNALDAQKKKKRLTGTMTIEVENRIFQCSALGMSPEENDLLACVSLLKALAIQKIILMETIEVPQKFLDPHNYIGKIFKKIA